MKKIILIFTGIIYFASINLTAQTILKKKEVSEKLILISAEINMKNYENALNILYSKDFVILAENVKDKEIETYNKSKEILDNKKTEFDNTKNKVSSLIQSYNSLDFDKAIELLEIKLSNENSYTETQKNLKEIIPKINNAKRSCDANRENIAKWQQTYNNQDYEKLFEIISYNNSLSNCFYSSDLIKLEKLQKDLELIYSIYNSVKKTTVSEPLKTLNSINYSYLDYEKSTRLLKELKDYLLRMTTESSKLKGENPLLINEISETKQKLETAIKKLTEYSEANKPLTFAEINTLLTSSKIISIAQIEKYFKPIDDEDIWNLGNIYNLDVIRYYDLKEYDTDLKKEVFKEKSEYKTKLAELKSIKSKTINNFYCLILNAGSYDNKRMLTDGGSGGMHPVEYDVSKGGFYINLGAYDMAMGGLPQVYREKFEFKSIPITKFKAYNEYGHLYDDYSYYRQMTFFPMDKTTGLKFEENKENIKVIALFKIDKIDIKKVLRISYYDYWYIASASKVRIIAYNEKTNEIYYDKIY